MKRERKRIFDLYDKKDARGKKKRLDSILWIATLLVEESDEKDIRKHPVYGLIRALINYQLYDNVRLLCEGEEVPEIENVFRDLGVKYGRDDNDIEYIKIDRVTDHERIEIDLSKDAIILCAWKQMRFCYALLHIGNDVGVDFEFKRDNHFSFYVEPIGVTVLYNGNHSTLCGILKGEGKIYPQQVYDITRSYDDMYFDGNYFRDIKTKQIIQEVEFFELGAVYEVGRIYLESLHQDKKADISEESDT